MTFLAEQLKISKTKLTTIKTHPRAGVHLVMLVAAGNNTIELKVSGPRTTGAVRTENPNKDSTPNSRPFLLFLSHCYAQ